jgi:hypothetical protein
MALVQGEPPIIAALSPVPGEGSDPNGRRSLPKVRLPVAVKPNVMAQRVMRLRYSELARPQARSPGFSGQIGGHGRNESPGEVWVIRCNHHNDCFASHLAAYGARTNGSRARPSRRGGRQGERRLNPGPKRSFPSYTRAAAIMDVATDPMFLAGALLSSVHCWRPWR